jgi:aminomuconate-semialdehyde/2-hydroxymuconate-6-semialdehyde dehydrogenase
MKIEHFIGGEFVSPASHEYLSNVEPATGKVYSEVANGDARDVERAVAAALHAFEHWATTPARDRSHILLELADLIENRVDEFAQAESIDTGKPISLARTIDIPRAISNLRFFATAILHTQTESHRTDARALNVTLRRPRGVCGLISPWNLPLYLFTWKIAPAIATGNTAVAKPSELTPMTAHLLSTLCEDAGLPPGVLNVVHGAGARAGAAIVSHPQVNTISFTGGTVTGARISQAAAPHFKKLALEMGGKNPNIVFADADLELALETSVQSSFSNQGQICLCGSRILVEQSVYDDFVSGLVERTARLKVGDPLEPATEQGALISNAHRQKVLSYVDLAVEEGGTIRYGGTERPAVSDRCKDGFFMSPTIITDLDVGCRVNQEEIFGPVVTVTPFDNDRDAVRYANNTVYGLSASIWTSNLSRAYRIADDLASGTVWINCWMLRDLRVPFGGVKRSGLGKEGGEEALRFFTEAKNVCVAL